MQTKTTVKQQIKDHVLIYLLNNPEHAIRIDKVRRQLKSWLR